MKKLYLSFVFIYFVFFISNAQDNPLSNILPPSPNASNLGVISQVPLDGNTGTAKYSIPIYTVNEGSLSVPISLKYSSNGVKPNELPSWVGRGWNLYAGGVITRVVKSKADIITSEGFFWKSDEVKDYIDGKITSVDERMNLLNNADLEPDEYCFNFAGYVGRFYRNNDKQREGDGLVNMKIESVPHYNFKYEIIGDGLNINEIHITTDNGTQYFFGGSGCIETTVTTDLSGNVSSEITAWYLKRIVSQNNDIIEFFYSDQYPIEVKTLVEFECEIVESSAGPIPDEEKSFMESKINSVFLERIKTSSTDIVFTNVEHRFSMFDNSRYTRRLDNIEIFNNN
ncbi:hypothetical protein, partial [Geofilum rubicundum]|uniref:hypothetical protein n=1 Tax=Geofilum rubicundum TaxID=472113 RepID=UPI001D0DCF19